MKPSLCFFLFSLIVVASFAQGTTNPPKAVWQFKTGAVMGAPVIDQGTVFVGSEAKSLHAIDLSSGKEKWKADTYGAIRCTPLVDGNYVYFISEDGTLTKLEKGGGKLAWRYFTPQGTLQERRYDKADYFQSSPIIYKDLVLFGMGDYLYAVNSETGTTAWTFKTGNVVHTRPAVSGDKVIIGSYDGHAYALQASTGAVIWKFKSVGQRFFPNGEMMGNPVAARNTVFIGSRDYNFYALDIHSGYSYWNKQFPKGWALAATLHKDSVLYLGTSDDYVMLALNPRTGAELWRTPLKYNIFGSMTVGGSTGYVGTLMGKLFAIDLKTGKIAWTFEGEGYKKNKTKYFKEDDTHNESALARFADFQEVLDMYCSLGAVFSSPAVTDDKIVFAGADGIVYCLNK